MRPNVPATLVVVVLLAGCVAPTLTSPLGLPEGGAKPLDAVTWAPLSQDHDHADASLHNASFNVEPLGFVSAWGDGAAFGGGVNELVVQGPYVYMSRSGPEGGFVVIDASDARAPQVIGEWRGEGGADIEVTADGNFVFLFSQRTVPDPQTVVGEAAPREHTPRGVFVVDVSNKRAPVYESFYPLPANGPHTGAYLKLDDGRDILTVQTYDLTPAQAGPAAEVLGVNPATQRVYILNFTTEAGVHVLKPLGTYQVLEPPTPGRDFFPHDTFLQRHPITGQLLMYVAYWDAGLRIVDVTDLANPVEIASFHDFSPSALAQLHYAEAFPVLIDGRHVTVVAPEIVTADESGQITLVDTTDPANPQYLGAFSVPGGLVVDAPFRFSPHNFDLDPFGRIYWGHNHAGVWVLDVGSPERLAAPAAVAYHEVDVSMRPDAREMRVWGVMWQDGLMYASEGSTGLHILRLKEGALPAREPGAI